MTAPPPPHVGTSLVASRSPAATVSPRRPETHACRRVSPSRPGRRPVLGMSSFKVGSPSLRHICCVPLFRRAALSLARDSTPHRPPVPLCVVETALRCARGGVCAGIWMSGCLDAGWMQDASTAAAHLTGGIASNPACRKYSPSRARRTGAVMSSSSGSPSRGTISPPRGRLPACSPRPPCIRGARKSAMVTAA